MNPLWWSLFLVGAASGIVAGFLAGLLGIGGGLIIVPVLSFALIELAPEYNMHLALGTSLASIVITSMASVWAHHRKQAVHWPVVLQLTPGLLLGSALAGALSARINVDILSMIFAVFCLLVAASFWWQAPRSERSMHAMPIQFIAGSLIGSVSALVGIGGGSMMVPWLSWHTMRIQHAIATSAACGLPIAVAATIGYLVAGQSVENLPSGSLGFVYLPALMGIGVTSVLMAPMGARLAHRLPRESLQRIFSGLLLLLAAYMFWR